MGSYCFPKVTGEGLAGSGWLSAHRSPRSRSRFSSLDTRLSETILCSFDFWTFHVPLLVPSCPSSPTEPTEPKLCPPRINTCVPGSALGWREGGAQPRCAVCPPPSPLCAVPGDSAPEIMSLKGQRPLLSGLALWPRLCWFVSVF